MIKKIVLASVNAKFSHTNLAIRYIKAAAGQFKEQITLKEYTINNNMDEIIYSIYEEKPDILGFSCYIWNIEIIKDSIKTIKKVLPDVIIILGGPEVYGFNGIMPECADIVIEGNGEKAFYEILVQINQGKEISGFCSLPCDFNTVPFPYTEDDWQHIKGRTIYYESQRGCPYKCSYCLSSIDKRMDFLPLDRVFKELDFFLNKKPRRIKFVDRTFNVHKQRAMEIWKYLCAHDNGITNFHFEIGGDLLDDETIEFLTSARKELFQFEIGVQSTHKETLIAINRNVDFDLLSKAVGKLIKAGNIHIHLDLIAGLPFESYDNFKCSFNDVYMLKPDMLQLGFLKVLKGTDIEKNFDKIIFRKYPPYEVLFTEHISFQELIKLKRIEKLIDLYYNSSNFKNALSLIENRFKDPFSMYEALSEFWQTRGYFEKPLNLVMQFKVIMEFWEFEIKQDLELFREALNFDFHITEPLKIPPEFLLLKTTLESDEDKRKRRTFYQNNVLIEKYAPSLLRYSPSQRARQSTMEKFQHIKEAVVLFINNYDSGKTEIVTLEEGDFI